MYLKFLVIVIFRLHVGCSENVKEEKEEGGRSATIQENFRWIYFSSPQGERLGLGFGFGFGFGFRPNLVQAE
jgi:hypothetical protein